MMRPTSRPQSALRAPLNALLGTEASIRMLRVLARADTMLSPAELARRAELQPSGVRRAIGRLAEHGIVDLVGTGPRQQVRWRDEHPLAAPLRALFEAEAARIERLLVGLRRAATTLRPPPDAVWIEDGFPAGIDQVGDPLLVGVLVRSGDAEDVADRLRAAVAELERREDVTIELRVRTRADVAAASPAEQVRLARSVAVFGLAPEAVIVSVPGLSTRRHAGGHADQDARALALARAIAARLASDPGLVARAREQLARRLAEASPREQRELREWEQVLRTTSPARLRRFLTDRGERATRLRQTLPFLDVLSPAEREAALAEARG